MNLQDKYKKLKEVKKSGLNIKSTLLAEDFPKDKYVGFRNKIKRIIGKGFKEGKDDFVDFAKSLQDGIVDISRIYDQASSSMQDKPLLPPPEETDEEFGMMGERALKIFNTIKVAAKETSKEMAQTFSQASSSC